MSGINGYRLRYKTNIERYKKNRINPDCFDPYYDYSGIVGDECRPIFPFKNREADSRFKSNQGGRENPDNFAKLTRKGKIEFESIDPLEFYEEAA